MYFILYFIKIFLGCKEEVNLKITSISSEFYHSPPFQLYEIDSHRPRDGQKFIFSVNRIDKLLLKKDKFLHLSFSSTFNHYNPNFLIKSTVSSCSGLTSLYKPLFVFTSDLPYSSTIALVNDVLFNTFHLSSVFES